MSSAAWRPAVASVSAESAGRESLALLSFHLQKSGFLPLFWHRRQKLAPTFFRARPVVAGGAGIRRRCRLSRLLAGGLNCRDPRPDTSSHWRPSGSAPVPARRPGRLTHCDCVSPRCAAHPRRLQAADDREAYRGPAQIIHSGSWLPRDRRAWVQRSSRMQTVRRTCRMSFWRF
jgi:hypothetical protein